MFPRNPTPPCSSAVGFTICGRESLRADIAAEAGFKSPNMLSMIKDGKAKLPIERAVQLAKALECDPAVLVRLALEQSLSLQLLAQIFAPPKDAPSVSELAILERIREVSGGSAPELSEALNRALMTVFDPESP